LDWRSMIDGVGIPIAYSADGDGNENPGMALEKKEVSELGIEQGRLTWGEYNYSIRLSTFATHLQPFSYPDEVYSLASIGLPLTKALYHSPVLSFHDQRLYVLITWKMSVVPDSQWAVEMVVVEVVWIADSKE
jgi:hypothetical protein